MRVITIFARFLHVILVCLILASCGASQGIRIYNKGVDYVRDVEVDIDGRKIRFGDIKPNTEASYSNGQKWNSDRMVVSWNTGQSREREIINVANVDTEITIKFLGSSDLVIGKSE